jgi:ankyrin repeat protein
MFRQSGVVLLLVMSAFVDVLAQTPEKIDFGRDVLPIFQQSCIGCHGPSQQMNGLRLDRRSSVFKVGERRVVPGSIENSLLVYRVSGNERGRQMPLTGPLEPAQINVIKTWVAQGAEWPDELANEDDVPPINSSAVAIVEALRAGDQKSFMKFLADDPALLNARGPEGSTPFMYAVLYSDAATLEQLLKKGANPNARNDAKATALMWAANDLVKTRILLGHGADVNAVSADFRTALTAAAARPGGAGVVKLLLDHGANPNITTITSPLIEAATAGDAESIQHLLSRGAVPKAVGVGAVILSARAGCSKCVHLLASANLDSDTYTAALGVLSYLGDVSLVRLAMDHGADVNRADPRGRTPLMYAAISDFMPVDVARLLIERGADLNAKSLHKESADSGLTALDLAKLRGSTPMVELLTKLGALDTQPAAVSLKPQRASTLRAAIERSLPLLQRTDASFTAQAGCISCHNNSLNAMAAGLSRMSGFLVDEKLSAQQVKANVAFLQQKRALLHQGYFFGAGQGDPEIAAYILIGLDAERYKPDLTTDAVAMFIRARQMPDGRWAFGTDGRPPLCADGDIAATVLSMRGLQLYSPKVEKAAYDRAIQLAAAWLANAQPRTEDDRSWLLLGLAWAGKNKAAIQKATREVLSVQRHDGGWSDLATTESNAYATGKALVALHVAGVPVSDPAYQRGVQYLMNNQFEDGSWFVKSRAAGLQPYFDNGFPHDVHQWVSAAATSWATMALTLASRTAAGN